MNKIWLDVTSVLNWHRPAVGIIRVETACAAYALRHLTSKVEFCRFDQVLGFVHVDAAQLSNHLDRSGRLPVTDDGRAAQNTVVSGDARPPLEVRLGRQAKRVLNRLPGRIRHPLHAHLSSRREAAHAVVSGLREFRRGWRAWRYPSVQTTATTAPPNLENKTVPFLKGDVYVSLGLDWDMKSQNYLYQQKELIQFRALLTCYDIIPVKFPHLCVGSVSAKFALYFTDTAWCADEILCISECSRRDLAALLDTLGAPTPELKVVTLGSDLPEPGDATVTSEVREAAGNRFILYVSTLERRKNHETLYKAYVRLIEQGETDLPRLLFIGMPGWGVGDLLADLQYDERVKDLIRPLTGVSDADLTWLYRNALFTVFPSLYEGWGLAVAESLANGKFCLASNAASIPEVGGDFLEYLDPWDVPQWAERLKWYFDHPEALRQAEDRIRADYVAPGWGNTAKTIFGEAEKLLDECISE